MLCIGVHTSKEFVPLSPIVLPLAIGTALSSSPDGADTYRQRHLTQSSVEHDRTYYYVP